MRSSPSLGVAARQRFRARDALARVGEDHEAEAALELLVVGDVVVVCMRREQVGDSPSSRSTAAIGVLHRTAAVDKDRIASGAVRDEVRVRQPLGVHAAFDDHGQG